jgi:hypothetical protein
VKGEIFVIYILYEFEFGDVWILGFAEKDERLSTVHFDKGQPALTEVPPQSTPCIKTRLNALHQPPQNA